MTLLEEPPSPVTAAGSQWQWQLRDKNGRWIQMGSEVSFNQNGKTITGFIVGSPGPGKATVKLADGSTVTVATAGVTATGKVATPPAQAHKAAAAAKDAASAGQSAKAAKPVKAVAPALKKKKASSERRRERNGGSSTGDEMATPDDKRLLGTHRTSRSIESLLRIRAKEKGQKDPFADEKKSSSKSKDGGSKDGEGSGAAKGGSAKGSSSGKRENTKKKLTQSQIDAVAVIMKAVLKHVKAGEYSTALGRLDNAKAILKDTSAPWSLKRIAYLQKGLKAGLGYTASGALVARGGPSWTWQLRDRLGQWIEMHSEVRWLAQGKTHTGHIVDSPSVKTAVVIEDVTGRKVNLSTSRLTGFDTHRFSSTPEVAGPFKSHGPTIAPRSTLVAKSDYMALRTLRMSAIRGFGGDTPKTNATEFGLARNNALQALDGAAQRDVSVADAVKKLAEARRQMAAARAWSDLGTRRAKLATLEAQIAQTIKRLDPDAAYLPKPKKPKVSVSATTKVRARQAMTSDWATTVIDRLGTISTLTSAGESWKWQLRDSHGQWIEMGSKVKWLALGKAYTGKVVGSPEAGVAIVEDDDGNRVRLASSRLTATEAPAATGPMMVSRRERRQLQRQERKQEKASIKQTPAMAAAMQDMADNIRDNVAPENQAAATEATADVIVGDIAGNLPKRHQLLERVKTLKEKGVDAQRRLAIYFQTRPALDSHMAKAHFWASEFLGDQGATDNPTPSWTAIPTMIGLPSPASHPIEFLTESSKMIGQLLKAAGSLVGSVIVGAGGDSWRWQLRDKDGQWIDMGSRVSWFIKGALRTGILIGSPKEGTARVRDDKTGDVFNMPSATRLTALPEVGNKVRYTTGGKNPKAVLAEVVGLPKAGRVDVKNLRTGAVKTVAETSVKVLPLDRLRAQVQEYGGLSMKIEGIEPTSGYMAAQLKGSVQLTPEEFFGDRGEDALFEFMRANQAQFDSDPDVYLGIWYDRDDNKVVIDVSHNIQDKDTAVLTGRYQNQKSVWDVVNMEEIDTGGTGGYGEAREEVRPTAEEGVGDDGRGVARLVPAADLGTPAAVDDRKFIRHPPPVGGLRIVDAKSSMAAHDPEAWEFINNDGGTLADPKHLRVNKRPTEGKPPSEMTASMSQMADHFTEVLRAAQAGVPYSDKANPNEMDAAPFWYERAHQTCLDLLEKYQDDGNGNGIPGLTIEKVTGVMAAMSPRMQWDANIVACEKILKAEADPEFRKISISRAKGSAEFTDILVPFDDQAKDMTKAGNTTFVEDSLQILRDEGDPTEIMGGLKRRSFWNSLLDPSNEWDVCIDGWMASATRRIGLTYQDGTPLIRRGSSGSMMARARSRWRTPALATSSPLTRSEWRQPGPG